MMMNCNECKGDIDPGNLLECVSCKYSYHNYCVGILLDDLDEKSRLKYVCPPCSNITRRIRTNEDTPIKKLNMLPVLPMDETFYNMSSVSLLDIQDPCIELHLQDPIVAPPNGEVVLQDEIKGKQMELLAAIYKEVLSLKSQNAVIPLLRAEISSLNERIVTMSMTILDLKSSLDNAVATSAIPKTTDSKKTFSTVLTSSSSVQPKSKLSVKSQPKPNAQVITPVEAVATASLLPLSSPSPPAPPPSSMSHLQLPAATDTYAARTRTSSVAPTNTNAKIQVENEDNWNLVTRKNRKSTFTEVRKGGNNSNEQLVKGMERRKYLHVWRLLKSTTENDLLLLVKKICGDSVEIKIHKIKPKTERDYSSFVITVPESSYDELNRPEVWPINVEFSDWIWFRPGRKNKEA